MGETVVTTYCSTVIIQTKSHRHLWRVVQLLYMHSMPRFLFVRPYNRILNNTHFHFLTIIIICIIKVIDLFHSGRSTLVSLHRLQKQQQLVVVVVVVVVVMEVVMM